MPTLRDHPRRIALNDELHARPFPRIEAPARALFIAIRAPGDATQRNKARDFDHLAGLLEHFGCALPDREVRHYIGPLGPHQIKWESHTEFVTYTLIVDGLADDVFDPALRDIFPQGWLESAPGEVISSILFRIEAGVPHDDIHVTVGDWFARESLTTADVLDGSMVIAGDFRLDPKGHTRFALFPTEDCGPQRIGRVLQRLCEIETYKNLSLLGLVEARKVLHELGEIEHELSRLMERISASLTDEMAQSHLDTILALSTQIEHLVSRSNYRFGATKAYENIVLNRVELLREERFRQRQMLQEFMLRRYDPSMRTVDAAMSQLESLAERAARAATLLRTKVDVTRQAQSAQLLKSLDRRADMQMRLQQTVEGLSVVAIGYYAVSLAGYALMPLFKSHGFEKTEMYAMLTPAVVILVWLALWRVKRRHFSRH